jgi:hypothetical protein
MRANVRILLAGEETVELLKTPASQAYPHV